MGNFLRATFLLLFLTFLVVFCGFALGGERGMGIAFILAYLMNLGSYWFCDKIVLAIHRAQLLTEDEASRVRANAL